MNNEFDNQFSNNNTVNNDAQMQSTTPIQNVSVEPVQSIPTVEPIQTVSSNNNKNKKSIKLVIIVAIIAIVIVGILVFLKNTNKDSNNNTNDNPKNNGITFIAPSATDTHKGIVYLNPINLETKCTKENSKIKDPYDGELVHSGCMKFYIYDDSGDNYKLILGHNTTRRLELDSSLTTEEYMKKIDEQLKKDTEGWTGNPRLISANEVAHILGADREDTLKWKSSKEYKNSYNNIDIETSVHNLCLHYSDANSYAKQCEGSGFIEEINYAWLYNYTDKCGLIGCEDSDDVSNIYGYYTSDVVVGESITGTRSSIWTVEQHRHHSGFSVNSLTPDAGLSIGIRPVITLSKDVIDGKK